MEQSARGVPVVTCLQPERFHDRLQSEHVFGQLRGANRRVFNECNRFFRPNAAGQKRETGFAHRPNQVHLRRVSENFRAKPNLSRFQDRQPLCHIVVELDDQNRFARFRIEFEQIARSLKMKLALGLIEQRPIDVFDRGGFEVEKLDRGLHRFGHRCEEN